MAKKKTKKLGDGGKVKAQAQDPKPNALPNFLDQYNALAKNTHIAPQQSQYLSEDGQPMEGSSNPLIAKMYSIRDSINSVTQKNMLDRDYSDSPKMKLTKGNFAGANVPTDLINDLYNSAKKKGVDPWTLMGLAGQESTLLNNRHYQSEAISGWAGPDKYMAEDPALFLANNKVPGAKAWAQHSGYTSSITSESDAGDYLKAHPEMIDKYRQVEGKRALTTPMTRLDMAVDYLKKKGVDGYNPGDPDYHNKIDKRITELRSDPQLIKYLMENGLMGSGNKVAKQEFGGTMASRQNANSYGKAAKAPTKKVMNKVMPIKAKDGVIAPGDDDVNPLMRNQSLSGVPGPQPNPNPTQEPVITPQDKLYSYLGTPQLSVPSDDYNQFDPKWRSDNFMNPDPMTTTYDAKTSTTKAKPKEKHIALKLASNDMIAGTIAMAAGMIPDQIKQDNQNHTPMMYNPHPYGDNTQAISKYGGTYAGGGEISQQTQDQYNRYIDALNNAPGLYARNWDHNQSFQKETAQQMGFDYSKIPEIQSDIAHRSMNDPMSVLYTNGLSKPDGWVGSKTIGERYRRQDQINPLPIQSGIQLTTTPEDFSPRPVTIPSMTKPTRTDHPNYYTTGGNDYSLNGIKAGLNLDGPRWHHNDQYGCDNDLNNEYGGEVDAKSGIHIKPSHKGRFTAYKKKHHVTTEQALHSKSAAVRKMANFARNSKHWKHENGGQIEGSVPENQSLKALAPTPMVDEQALNEGMMKGRMATDDAFGNPSAHRMIQNYPETYTFTGKENFPKWMGDDVPPQGAQGTHYMSSMGKYAVPYIQEANKGLQFKPNASPRDKESMRFNSDSDAEYFAEHYKEVAPMMRNGQFEQGGSINYKVGQEVDLTRAQIKHLESLGYKLQY